MRCCARAAVAGALLLSGCGGLDPGAHDIGPPEALECLSRWYGGEPVEMAGGWVLRFTDGTELVFDDGREKTFEELLNEPDLKDILSIPYETGPMTPVTAENHDPGRFRVQELLMQRYGADEDAVLARTVEVPMAGRNVRVHADIAAVVERVAARLNGIDEDPTVAEYLALQSWGFLWKTIMNTDRLSAHSFGIAIDVAYMVTEYWLDDVKYGRPFEWHNSMPGAIVDAFEAEHFVWGGRWYHYDTMHFEYRPELFDPTCRL